VCEGRAVHLRYRGLDDVVRTTGMMFDPAPTELTEWRAIFRLSLAPGATGHVAVTAIAANTETPAAAAPGAGRRRRPSGDAQVARVETDNAAFNGLVARSLADLDMLITRTPDGPFPYAGVPWYVAPFGRDSLITAFQLLPYRPAVAAGTLRFLAARQGTTVDEFLDEEPGKILHEYRRGEMANCREIPFVPYYGTIDATPLFLMLLGEYARWTGDLGLVRELWPSARAALRWMRAHGDRDGDGYLEYEMRSRIGLGNQGWKDSEDAVSHADGRLARPPIALVEVQGYAYAALRSAADLVRVLGLDDDAGRLEAEAQQLRKRFDRDFWMEEQRFCALALDGDKLRCEVVASNAGHCLWTGILTPDRAARVAERLLENDLFSGWGVRTLSSRERRYNPMSYHNGSVWPHDNAIAAAGLRRYGFAGGVSALMSALFDAARYFEHARIPELFCGFARQPDFGPIAYPVACAPQAWAAGAPLQMLTALVGLQPDAALNRLTCESPTLPPWLRFVELHGVQVGASSVDLAITRGREEASVELLSRRGDVELVVRR
jgi:glycogen debranching enzyme